MIGYQKEDYERNTLSKSLKRKGIIKPYIDKVIEIRDFIKLKTLGIFISYGERDGDVGSTGDGDAERFS